MAFGPRSFPCEGGGGGVGGGLVSQSGLEPGELPQSGL